MTSRNDSNLVRLLGSVSAGAAICVFSIGCLVLIGWVFDIAVLKSLNPHLVSMKADTALAFMLTGISLWLSQVNRIHLQAGRYVAWGSASAVAAVGLLTLMEYSFGWNLGIDQLLFTEPVGTVQTFNPGRMAPNTALDFLLIGLSLLLLDVKTRRGHRPAQYLISLEGTIAFAALVGYIYGASRLYSPSTTATAMSLPAVLAGILTFIGLFLARPAPGLLTIMTGENTGSILVRRFLLPILLVPILLDVLLLTEQRTGLYSERFASAAHVVLQTAFFLYLIWVIAASLNRIDSARRKAEAASARLASFPELNPNPVVEIDATGQIHYVNPAARCLFPDLLERGFQHPWLAGFEPVVSAFRTDQTQSAVREVAIGKRCYQQMAHYVGEGQRTHIYGLDITERKLAEQAVRDREEELTAIYDNAPLVMMLMDGERHIHKMNKQAEIFADASVTDLLGRRGGEALRCLYALEDPRGCGFGQRCQHCVLRRSVIDTFKTGHSQHKLEATLPFAIGGKPQDVTFLLSTSRLDVRGRPLVLVTMQDITARKQAEVALQRAHDELEMRVQQRTAELWTANLALQCANRALKALSGCNEALVRATSEVELLNEICRIIVEVSGYRMAWVGFAEQDKKKTVRPVAKAGFETGYLEKAKITWADTPRGRGPTGRAIRTAQVVVNRNFLTNPRLSPWRDDAINRGYASSVALPLLDNGRCLGALTIYATELEAFNAEELVLLRELASDMTFGIATLRTRAERERLQAELLQISEREQERIGRDLHDSLGQQLTGIAYLTGTLKEELTQCSRAQAAKAARIGKLLNTSIEEVRTLARGLDPIKPIEQGLMAALHELAATVRQLHKVPCRFDCARPVLVDDDRAAINLYRIAQEAVRNAVVHGKPKHIWIQLHRERGCIRLVVKDDGKGLLPPPRRSKGMGLEIMRYRAEAIGASFEIRRGDRRGTMVICSWTEPGIGSKETRHNR